jgi:hypothetical protein
MQARALMTAALTAGASLAAAVSQVFKQKGEKLA